VEVVVIVVAPASIPLALMLRLRLLLVGVGKGLAAHGGGVHLEEARPGWWCAAERGGTGGADVRGPEPVRECVLREGRGRTGGWVMHKQKE
jgi:hypothetical protein